MLANIFVMYIYEYLKSLPHWENEWRFHYNARCVFTALLWRAPELLRHANPPAQGTQEGDVYSYSIIMSELVTKARPYAGLSQSTPQIVHDVRAGTNPLLVPQQINFIQRVIYIYQ